MLKHCLASITLQSNTILPIIIIDNCSTDQTKEIVKQYQINFPNIIYRYEEKIGLGNARNNYLNDCKTEYIHYLDDDLELDPHFITNLNTFLKTYKPDAYTGKITARFIDHKPKWYKNSHLTGGNDQLKTGPLDQGFIMGGNMGFKTELLIKIGGFPDNFGKGSSILFGEETYVEYLFRRSNYHLFYGDNIGVQHFGLEETIWKHLWLSYQHDLSGIYIKQTLKMPLQSWRRFLSNLKRFISYLGLGWTKFFTSQNYYIQNWIIDCLKPLICNWAIVRSQLMVNPQKKS